MIRSHHCKKSQSFSAICKCYRDELIVLGSIYSYIDTGVLEGRNIDLRRKLHRPKQKKSGQVLRIGPEKCHIEHSDEEYEKYMRPNPDAMVNQTDSGGRI